jgi:Arc/MetJ-type ribon-helix-helix transcriptional regulator
VREGLRLLEQRQDENRARLEWLRSAIKHGLDQIDHGEGIDIRDILRWSEKKFGKNAALRY